MKAIALAAQPLVMLAFWVCIKCYTFPSLESMCNSAVASNQVRDDSLYLSDSVNKKKKSLVWAFLL